MIVKALGNSLKAFYFYLATWTRPIIERRCKEFFDFKEEIEMGKFARIIDRIVTVWTILVDLFVGFIMSAFAVAAMFQDMYSDIWRSVGLTLTAVVTVNVINFVIKIFLRSFPKKK